MKVYIIGGGCGGSEMMTGKAYTAINRCEVIIGPERMINLPFVNKKVFKEYKAENIKQIIDCENKDTAVIMGGDSGFYSGTKKLLELLKGYDTEVIPGISSISYFAAKLKLNWENWKISSLHGMKNNIIGYVKENKYTFIILSGSDDIKDICNKLILYKMDYVTLYVGENLSYDDERIERGTAASISKMSFKKLAVMLIVNEKAEKSYGLIPDDEFIRGKVPMTKAEIRSVSLLKLGLRSNAVFYDVGSGTGSVAVSAALLDPEIKVYAIEKKKEALELIGLNKIKFAVDNLDIIEGKAPDVLEYLPSPTHVFIGGSDGNTKEIIDCVREKNKNVKIVINTVTMETLCGFKKYTEEHSIAAEFVQINSSRGENMGKYTLMKASNPVYIISF